jgi:RNA polymerase sigma-70 factor (ECF subfamily)
MFGQTLPAPARDSSPVARRRRVAKIRVVQDSRRPDVTSNSPATPPDNAVWIGAIARIRDHADEAAFVALFRHFAPRIKGFLIRSGADPTMAEECVQDVMATVWRKSAQFDPGRASVATWIFTIARNRRIDLLRRQQRPEPEDLGWGPEEETDQQTALEMQQDSEALGRAIAELPVKQRELIEKAYFGELSHSEIADVTGLPLGTIKSRIRLALDRLRHAMDRT